MSSGGFDEQYFVGEEVYFSLALKKLGRFKVLREPIVTSGRKLRMYPAKQFLRDFFGVSSRSRGSVARSPTANGNSSLTMEPSCTQHWSVI